MCSVLYSYKECWTLFRHAVQLLRISLVLLRFAFSFFICSGLEHSWSLGLISACYYWGLYTMPYALQSLPILDDGNMNYYPALGWAPRIVWLYKSKDMWSSALEKVLYHFFDNFVVVLYFLGPQWVTYWNFWIDPLIVFNIASSIFHLFALFSARCPQLHFPKQQLGFLKSWSLDC